MYLYHEHAAQLTNRDDSLPAFVVFALVPGVAVAVGALSLSWRIVASSGRVSPIAWLTAPVQLRCPHRASFPIVNIRPPLHRRPSQGLISRH